MSKLRRNNMFCKSKTNEIKDMSTNGKFSLNKNKFMSTDEFFNRIQKSLYYGDRKSKLSIPLSDYIADTFSDTHSRYSLNRLNYSTVGNLQSTPCTLILALCYLERLKEADPAYTKRVSPAELFLVSMMVATKFYSGHDDEAPHVNWTDCMNSENLLELELSFLNAIDWNCYVSREEFFEKVKSLEIVLAQQQGMKRGFFTYLEMSSVMPPLDDVTYLIQSVIVLSFSYTVFVATMVASVFLVSQIPGSCLHNPTQNISIQTTVSNTNTNTTEYPSLQNVNELNESENKFFGYDLTLILNEDIDENQREKLNATTWIPAVFSLFPVIFNENMACSGLNLTFLEASIDGIKRHWV